MISLEKRIEALVELGLWLKSYETSKAQHVNNEADSIFFEFNKIVRNQHIYNHWLIEQFVDKAIGYWAERLSRESINWFTARYTDLQHKHSTIDVAVIPQQNIPLAGFHDAICIWLAGYRFFAKNINHELYLLQYITNKLIDLEPALNDLICWVDTFPKTINAYLVHSKPNENEVLKQYFSSKRCLIRQKRISVAVLLPNFTCTEIAALSGDILDFFGQSNHNVRKIYVPTGFSVEQFYPSIEHYAWMQQNNRYANNFDYHRSIFLMDRIEFFENGFLILRQSPQMQVPIGCLHFEYYNTIDELTEKLTSQNNNIQQVICKSGLGIEASNYGTAHNYMLWNYDDEKDVMSFLLDAKINKTTCN